LFSAADLGAANTFVYSNTVDNLTETFTVNITGIGEFFIFRSINFDDTGRQSNLAGPGTVEGPAALPTLMILNKLAPLFDNGSSTVGTNNFLLPGEPTQIQEAAWGTFDGTTNTPVLYPNGTTFEERENSLIGPAPTTPFLPNATIGVPYSAQLTAAGGTPPYTWALAPTSPGLPAGLNLSADGKIAGTPSGPASIYDFTVRIMDSAGVFRDVQYTITLY
jgi:hypothetical protein